LSPHLRFDSSVPDLEKYENGPRGGLRWISLFGGVPRILTPFSPKLFFNTFSLRTSFCIDAPGGILGQVFTDPDKASFFRDRVAAHSFIFSSHSFLKPFPLRSSCSLIEVRLFLLKPYPEDLFPIFPSRRWGSIHHQSSGTSPTPDKKISLSPLLFVFIGHFSSKFLPPEIFSDHAPHFFLFSSEEAPPGELTF